MRKIFSRKGLFYNNLTVKCVLSMLFLNILFINTFNVYTTTVMDGKICHPKGHFINSRNFVWMIQSLITLIMKINLYFTFSYTLISFLLFIILNYLRVKIMMSLSLIKINNVYNVVWRALFRIVSLVRVQRVPEHYRRVVPSQKGANTGLENFHC